MREPIAAGQHTQKQHRRQLSYVYNLRSAVDTLLVNAGGITNAILGGLLTSGLLVLSSGQPFTVVDGISIPGGDARPKLMGDPFAPGPGCPETMTPQCWFNPAAFQNGGQTSKNVYSI